MATAMLPMSAIVPLVALAALIAAISFFRRNRIASPTGSPRDEMLSQLKALNAGLKGLEETHAALDALPAEGVPQVQVDAIMAQLPGSLTTRAKQVEALRGKWFEAHRVPDLQAILSIVTAPGFAGDEDQPRLAEKAVTVLMTRAPASVLADVAALAGPVLIQVRAALSGVILEVQTRAAAERLRSDHPDTARALEAMAEAFRSARPDAQRAMLDDLLSDLDAAETTESGDLTEAAIRGSWAVSAILDAADAAMVAEALAQLDARAASPFWRILRLNTVTILLDKSGPVPPGRALAVALEGLADPEPGVHQTALGTARAVAEADLPGSDALRPAAVAYREAGRTETEEFAPLWEALHEDGLSGGHEPG